MFLKAQAAISLFTCTCMLGAATVPASSIGTATANGEMQVDGSSIRSNSTLFDGSVLQTSRVRSDVRLADGSQLVLNPDSRITLYRDRGVLQQGLAMQRNADKHAIVANGLKVASEAPSGTVLVDIQNSTHMKVEAQRGAADVRTAAGDLVARIEPGKALSFDTAPRESLLPASIKIAGTLRPISGQYALTDKVSGVTFQLRGANLATYAGSPVQVIGMIASATPSVPGASRVVDVSQASPEAAVSENAAAGNQGDQDSPAVSPVNTPFFDKTTILLLVIIAEVGVFGGLAAAGAFSGAPSVSPK